MKRILAAALAIHMGACGSPRAQTHQVRVAAAADLRFGLEELSSAFRRQRPDIELAISYGSSGNFVAQIQNGAPFDLFLSADGEYPRRLASLGLTVAGSEFDYAVGRLALWVPSASHLAIDRGLACLADAGRVAIANPEHAPYGRAAIAALRAAGMLDSVQPRLVLGENVAQALQFAQTGGADAGIVALSLALAPSVRESGHYREVPRELYPPLRQGGVIVKRTTELAAAEDVRAFLTSDDARAVLARYGFNSPDGR